jgi:hypothetical protein
VGADLLARFPDGTWFIELAPLDRAELVGEAVAAVFGLPLQGNGWPRTRSRPGLNASDFAFSTA